jgi:hypothetical protein
VSDRVEEIIKLLKAETVVVRRAAKVLGKIKEIPHPSRFYESATERIQGDNKGKK